MLRASQSAQDCGYERLQEQAEDDDQDESQCIFHNHELISFPFIPSLPAPGMRIFFFPVEIQIKMSLDYIG